MVGLKTLDDDLMKYQFPFERGKLILEFLDQAMFRTLNVPLAANKVLTLAKS